jgi:hypothetical protein
MIKEEDMKLIDAAIKTHYQNFLKRIFCTRSKDSFPAMLDGATASIIEQQRRCEGDDFMAWDLKEILQRDFLYFSKIIRTAMAFQVNVANYDPYCRSNPWDVS